MTLLLGSAESQRRTLTIIGAALLACAIIAVFVVMANPFSSRPPDRISVAIDTPFVGQGVSAGTAVVMHGVRVGEVTNVTSLPSGGVRLATDLQAGPVSGLTDTVSVDFRPINYFGVTGVNLMGNPGGRLLRDGTQISTVPTGNFTLQSLLSRLNEVSSSALTPQLIQVIDRATRYTDGLNPLIETVLIASNTIAKVQNVSAQQLLYNTTAVSVPTPSFINAATDAADAFISSQPSFGSLTEEVWQKKYIAFLDAAGGLGLFGAIGKLESSHIDDLLPTIQTVKALSDTVPVLTRPEDLRYTLAELRSRFEKMFGGNGEQRALQVRILLDNVPAVAAPLGVLGAPQ